jgi:hypothetical protein
MKDMERKATTFVVVMTV